MKIKKLNKDAIIPTKNMEAAGLDLYALEDVIVKPNEKAKVKTGISVELPKDTFAQVVGRSGISLKTPLNVITGTIDNDYRGDIGVIIHNTSQLDYIQDIVIRDGYVNTIHFDENKKVIKEESKKHIYPVNTYKIKKGDKIAQLVVMVQPVFSVEEVSKLEETDRGNKGFGSSGTV